MWPSESEKYTSAASTPVKCPRPCCREAMMGPSGTFKMQYSNMASDVLGGDLGFFVFFTFFFGLGLDLLLARRMKHMLSGRATMIWMKHVRVLMCEALDGVGRQISMG